MQAWLSVAAGQTASGPAAARLITMFSAKVNPEDLIGRAHGLLKVMEAQLAKRSFLVENVATPTATLTARLAATLADIAVHRG